ncbi:MAG TPA: pirin family protein, partial [Gallionellaceae bacterium]|nr:pirin family protein [Gallionellaceae bacterium]
MEFAVTCSRTIEHVIAGQAISDGAGVKLTRLLAHGLQRRLDPFLMLDVFKSDNPDDYLAGFPDHPHRGFETVTYMLAGRMRHRDNAGHGGLLECGDVQWMTAGRGIVHSEMPEPANGEMEGLQLWVNLAAKDKMCMPWYHDIKSAAIPEFSAPGGARVRLIAGRSHGVVGAVERPVTEPLCLDIHFEAGQSYAQVLAAECNAFICV